MYNNIVQTRVHPIHVLRVRRTENVARVMFSVDCVQVFRVRAITSFCTLFESTRRVRFGDLINGRAKNMIKPWKVCLKFEIFTVGSFLPLMVFHACLTLYLYISTLGLFSLSQPTRGPLCKEYN